MVPFHFIFAFIFKCRDTLKAGGDGTQGATSNELRHSIEGTVFQFMDAFETVHRNWIPHRYHAVQAKQAERELERNLTPGKVKDDSDW